MTQGQLENLLEVLIKVRAKAEAVLNEQRSIAGTSKYLSFSHISDDGEELIYTGEEPWQNGDSLSLELPVRCLLDGDDYLSELRAKEEAAQQAAQTKREAEAEARL